MKTYLQRDSNVSVTLGQYTCLQELHVLVCKARMLKSNTLDNLFNFKSL